MHRSSQLDFTGPDWGEPSPSGSASLHYPVPISRLSLRTPLSFQGSSVTQASMNVDGSAIGYPRTVPTDMFDSQGRVFNRNSSIIAPVNTVPVGLRGTRPLFTHHREPTQTAFRSFPNQSSHNLYSKEGLIHFAPSSISGSHPHDIHFPRSAPTFQYRSRGRVPLFSEAQDDFPFGGSYFPLQLPAYWQRGRGLGRLRGSRHFSSFWDGDIHSNPFNYQNHFSFEVSSRLGDRAVGHHHFFRGGLQNSSPGSTRGFHEIHSAPKLSCELSPVSGTCLRSPVLQLRGQTNPASVLRSGAHAQLPSLESVYKPSIQLRERESIFRSPESPPTESFDIFRDNQISTRKQLHQSVSGGGIRSPLTPWHSSPLTPLGRELTGQPSEGGGAPVAAYHPLFSGSSSDLLGAPLSHHESPSSIAPQPPSWGFSHNLPGLPRDESLVSFLQNNCELEQKDRV